MLPSFLAFFFLPFVSSIDSRAGGEAHDVGGRTVMIASGITSVAEQCLTVAPGRGAVSLESCADAVSIGDGRELFTFDSGKIVSKSGTECLSLGEADEVVVGSCVAASKFEFRGNGQLAVGDGLCVSQAGLAAGTGDMAMHAAASATSNAAREHGPSMAVDGRSTYWASGANPDLPVELSVDLGSSGHLDAIEIDWEHFAKSFSVQTSNDGVRWSDVYSTDVNTLDSTYVVLGGTAARHVKVVMREAQGSLFGIRRLAVLANRLTTVAVPCFAAASSVDARDKYFPVIASQSASGTADLTGLELSVKALAGAVSALSEASDCV